MAEERRVRFTDDYVPGPKGCPVWAIEMQWTFGVPVYIRAESEDEALHVFDQWSQDNPGVMDSLMNDAVNERDRFNVEITSWYHAGADNCWKE